MVKKLRQKQRDEPSSNHTLSFFGFRPLMLKSCPCLDLIKLRAAEGEPQPDSPSTGS